MDSQNAPDDTPARVLKVITARRDTLYEMPLEDYLKDEDEKELTELPSGVVIDSLITAYNSFRVVSHITQKRKPMSEDEWKDLYPYKPFPATQSELDQRFYEDIKGRDLKDLPPYILKDLPDEATHVRIESLGGFNKSRFSRVHAINDFVQYYALSYVRVEMPGEK